MQLGQCEDVLPKYVLNCRKNIFCGTRCLFALQRAFILGLVSPRINVVPGMKQITRINIFIVYFTRLPAVELSDQKAAGSFGPKCVSMNFECAKMSHFSWSFI
jgi:hypothetical protein